MTTPVIRFPYSTGPQAVPLDVEEARRLFMKRLNGSVHYARFFMFLSMCFLEDRSPTLRQASNVVNISTNTRRVIYTMMERLEIAQSMMVKVRLNSDDKFESSEVVLTKGRRFDADALTYTIIASETLKRHRAKHAE